MSEDILQLYVRRLWCLYVCVCVREGEMENKKEEGEGGGGGLLMIIREGACVTEFAPT